MEQVDTAHKNENFALKTGGTFWFTGLSGAGKSTLSQSLKAKLDTMFGNSKKVFLLEEVGLNKNCVVKPVSFI